MKQFIALSLILLTAELSETKYVIKKFSQDVLKKEYCDVEQVPDARCGLCKCNKEMTKIYCVGCPMIQCRLEGKGPERFERDIHEDSEDCCPAPNCDEIDKNINISKLDLINEGMVLKV